MAKIGILTMSDGRESVHRDVEKFALGVEGELAAALEAAGHEVVRAREGGRVDEPPRGLGGPRRVADARPDLTVFNIPVWAFPHFSMLAANEPGVLGAAEAMYRPNKDGEIVIVGWDASPAEVEALKAGVVMALVIQNPFQMGYKGVDAAVEMIRTGEKVESEPTGTTYVTEENLNDPEVQAVVNPTCENQTR